MRSRADVGADGTHGSLVVKAPRVTSRNTKLDTNEQPNSS